MSAITRLLDFQAHKQNGSEGLDGLPNPPFVRFDSEFPKPIQRLWIDPWAGRNALLAKIDVPAEWKEGLLRLSGQGPPDNLSEERWEQIIDDVDYLATDWATIAARLGWNMLDLFGHSPQFARRLDRDGLAVLLDGRKLSALNREGAVIINEGTKPTVYRRKLLLGSRPLWMQN